MFDYWFGWFPQTLLFASFAYTCNDLFYRVQPYILQFAYKIWWYGLDVYIEVNDFYCKQVKQKLLFVYLILLQSFAGPILFLYDCVRYLLPSQYSTLFIEFCQPYIDGLLRYLAHLENNNPYFSFMGRQPQNNQLERNQSESSKHIKYLPNPFISLSVQLKTMTPHPEDDTSHLSAMNDIILPNNVIEKYCIPNLRIDAPFLLKLLKNECKHLVSSACLKETDLSLEHLHSLTILDHNVNVNVIKLHGSEAKCVVIGEITGFTIETQSNLSSDEATTIRYRHRNKPIEMDSHIQTELEGSS